MTFNLERADQRHQAGTYLGHPMCECGWAGATCDARQAIDAVKALHADIENAKHQIEAMAWLLREARYLAELLDETGRTFPWEKWNEQTCAGADHPQVDDVQTCWCGEAMYADQKNSEQGAVKHGL